MAKTYDDEVKNINSMYDNNLALANEQLTADYMAADKKIDEEKLKAQQATDANLNRTAVEAQKADMSREELYNAYGLSSGARAQARLASENRARSDMATLREQLQDTEATLERERTSLSEQYASAIRQAQQANDLAKAQALYEAAQREDERIAVEKQQATELEKQRLQIDAEAKNKELERKIEAALQYAKETDDYSLYLQLTGLTESPVAPGGLNGIVGDPPAKVKYNDLSQTAKDFVSSLPYASNGQGTQWKYTVYDKLNSLIVSGKISNEDALSVIEYLGIDKSWKRG